MPAIITIEFTQDTEFYLGLINMAMAFGLMLGPVVGILLIGVLSYANTLYCIGFIVLVVVNISACFIPSRVNDHKATIGGQSAEQKVPISRFFVSV